MKDSIDRVAVCTTPHFDGVIAVIDPETSWVARWQRTGAPHFIFFPPLVSLLTLFVVAKYVRGMYAVRVKGRIPEDVEDQLQARGITYRPRDQTDLD